MLEKARNTQAQACIPSHGITMSETLPDLVKTQRAQENRLEKTLHMGHMNWNQNRNSHRKRRYLLPQNGKSSHIDHNLIRYSPSTFVSCVKVFPNLSRRNYTVFTMVGLRSVEQRALLRHPPKKVCMSPVVQPSRNEPKV